MNNIFISYIIPCFNVGKYLSKCFGSLERQVIGNGSGIEFVFVNDGSTDNSFQLLKTFELKEKRAIVINQKNQGVSFARNTGLNVAKGKYVFFLDSDDWLTDDASQILYDVSKESEPDIVITNAYKEIGVDVKKEWNPCNHLKSGNYEILDFAQCVYRLPISFKAYRRELLLQNNIAFNELLPVGEVYAFFLNAMTCSNRIVFTDKRVMTYLVRSGSVMRTININRDSVIVKTMHYIDECATNKMPALRNIPSYKRSLFDIVNMFCLVNYIRSSSYTKEIGFLLKTIKKDKVYNDLQKYFIFKEFRLNRRSLYSLVLFFLPVPFAYCLLRFAKVVKRLF